VKFNNKIDKLNKESKENNPNFNINDTLNNTKFDQTVIFENESDDEEDEEYLNNNGFNISNYFNYSFEWFKK